jgi:hypothetical protein
MSFKSESLDGQLLGQGLRAHVIAKQNLRMCILLHEQNGVDEPAIGR